MQKNSAWKFNIRSLGMVTPVGHNAKQSCTSIRAGISRFSESEFRIPDQKDHMFSVQCAAATGITDGHRRFLRIFRMAMMAFEEVILQSKMTEAEIRRSGLYLCLAEDDRPGMDNRAEQHLVKRMSEVLGLEDFSARSKVINKGHASVFFAIQEAIKDLEQNKYQFAIIGGVDTYLDELTLIWLQDFNFLKTDTHNDGFIPGEAAAFFVLERQRVAIGRKYTPIAKIEGGATSNEENSIYDEKPCKGEGLNQSINKTFLSLEDGGVQTGLVICDLNGQRYRAMEWGLATSRAFRESVLPFEVWHPADCIGNTGAAAGPINICHGAMALSCGYAVSPNILVWGSSDDGERGSVYLRSISKELETIEREKGRKR